MEQGKNSRLNLLFVLTSILALAVLVQDFRFDNDLSRERTAAVSLDREVSQLEVAVSDLRAAETGYLATGQGPEFWMRRATQLLQQLDGGITRLTALSPTGETAGRLKGAATALADVANIDQRVRENIEQDQRFLASDLVFMEGQEATQRLTGELAGARKSALHTAEGRLTSLSRLRLAMNAVALALLLGVALYAGRTAARAPAASPAASMAQMLRELPPPVKPAPPVRSPTPAPATVNFSDAADLCVDLARVMDERDIAGLLERTAKILEAKGVIIWVIDHEGQTLRPSLSHGYSEKIVARLGTLSVTADNVTSLSFRSMRPETMNGAGPGIAGAIAVPLVTAAGCTGVMAAEVKDSKPAAEAIALAKIIAAQFATLIAPGEAATTRAAEA